MAYPEAGTPVTVAAQEFMDLGGEHSFDWRNEELIPVWELQDKYGVGRHRFSSIPRTVAIRFMVGDVLVREVC